MPLQFVEEILDDVQIACTSQLVIDIFANSQVEHAQTEWRKHHRAICVRPHPSGHDVTQCAVQKLSASCELFGKMWRSVGFEAMLHVIDNVGRSENDLRCEVSERYVEHQWIVFEPGLVVHMRLPGDCCKHDQVA